MILFVGRLRTDNPVATLRSMCLSNAGTLLRSHPTAHWVFSSKRNATIRPADRHRPPGREHTLIGEPVVRQILSLSLVLSQSTR